MLETDIYWCYNDNSNNNDDDGGDDDNRNIGWWRQVRNQKCRNKYICPHTSDLW